MLRHYYTLEKVAGELRQLTGFKLIECFSQEKNSIEMVFYDGVAFSSLHFSADTLLGSIYLRKNFSRARKNTADILSTLAGEVLQDAVIHPSDRIIVLKFIHKDVYAVLFGGAKNNLIVTDKNSIVLDAFKNVQELKDSVFSAPVTGLKQLTGFLPDTKLLNALSLSDALLGKYYASELCFRNDLDPQAPVSSFTVEELDVMGEQAWQMRRECEDSRTCYILRNEDKKEEILSLIRLHAYPEVVSEHDSISEAISRRVVSIIKSRGFGHDFNQLNNQLERLQKKLSSGIEQIKDKDKSLERAEKYRLWAEILLAQPNPKLKPGDKINLADWSGNIIEIPLDSKLSLIENGSRYYGKARDAKENFIMKEKLLPRLQKDFYDVNKAIDEIKKASNIRQIYKIKDSVRHLIGINMLQEEKEPSQKFREFDLGEGYMLYVGKSAANNDELTMKFAKPNDLWLHARGSAGSHAVLKMEKEEKPPKYILQKAASITAYYSQAKNAKYVPVAYTFKKYVRKPKGANPGSVVLSKEDVIMAEPKLPEF